MLDPLNAAHSLQRPPQSLRGGVHPNLLADDSVTFVMHAPYKPFVALVGDFNGWNSRANALVSDGQGTWWTTVPHPGPTRYGYYVAVDDQAHAWVGDPYATELRWDDQGAWAYLPAQAESFAWTDQKWRTPGLRDLIIYELNVRDFAGRWVANRPRYGNFAATIELLDYLVELGVNAIELMPIQAFPGESSWGYNPVFYFAPAEVYGNSADFKHLVDCCHDRGLAVILDVAFNHAWGRHPYYQFYPPMFGSDGAQLENWNPFFHHTPASVNMWGGVDWNHFSSHTTRYFQDVVAHWLLEYHVDGFRFDWVAGVDYDSHDPYSAEFNPYHGISAICWAARQARPDCILVGEYWSLEGTNPAKTAARLVAETPMDACWNGTFHHTLDDILNQRWEWEKQDVQRAVGGYRDEGFRRSDQVINYTCSHDEVRLEHEVKYYTGRYIDIPDRMSLAEVALAKAALGLVALFTAPGVPMLYAGQEFGEDAPRTIDFLPLHWEKIQQAAHAEHLEFVKRLVRLRHSHPCLRGDHIRFYDEDFAADKVLRYERWDDRGDFVVVALNFGHEAKRVSLELPHSGLWRDFVSEKSQILSQRSRQLMLEPWSYALLISAGVPGTENEIFDLRASSVS
jgi:1,4-alpha-glucan branching enzyme